ATSSVFGPSAPDRPGGAPTSSPRASVPTAIVNLLTNMALVTPTPWPSRPRRQRAIGSILRTRPRERKKNPPPGTAPSVAGTVGLTIYSPGDVQDRQVVVRGWSGNPETVYTCVSRRKRCRCVPHATYTLRLWRRYEMDRWGGCQPAIC